MIFLECLQVILPHTNNISCLRRRLMIFIMKDFRTIVFIFIVIFTTFRPICPLAFFKCLSNSGTFTELQTRSFIESTGGDTGILNTCTRLWLTESEQATPVVRICAYDKTPIVYLLGLSNWTCKSSVQEESMSRVCEACTCMPSNTLQSYWN